jgi:tRNA 5-methylaminomethyl-2-thiouridine biosynthesis bifunctional protein
VVPRSLCRAWLAHPDIVLKTEIAVARLRAAPCGWQLLDVRGRVFEADAVVLANAHEAARLAPDQPWPLHTVRGQVTVLPAGSLPEIGRVIAREGYVACGAGVAVVGATYEHGSLDTRPCEDSDAANLARLDAILPGASARIAAGTTSGRAALRATLPDRLPMLGALDGHPGVSVAAGYASRGVVWAGLLGETLADRLFGRPAPLETDLLRALSPGRFRRR